MNKDSMVLGSVLIVIILTLSDFRMGLAALILLSLVLFALKKIERRDVGMIIIPFFIFSIAYFLFFLPALNIAKTSGPVLSDNWWNALNWIKNNTAECATIATYWDPGHFITGIARRPVVFDGASQGALRTVSIGGKYEKYRNASDGLILENYDKGIVQIIFKRDGTITRARIKDIATSLFTDNETLAINLLEDYKKPNCDEMYYIASADLIGKSVWWTYFATWDPTKPDPKGTMYSYTMPSLTEAKPLIAEDAIAYKYFVGRDVNGREHWYIIYDRKGELIGRYQIGNNFFNLGKVIDMDTGKTYEQGGETIPGTILLFNRKQMLVHIPSELENALFTKLFFFNGAGLEHFEFVDNWGGEVKLFRIKFD